MWNQALDQTAANAWRCSQAYCPPQISFAVLLLSMQRYIMTPLLKALQICSVLAITVGAATVAALYVLFVSEKALDMETAFGVGAITFGTLGLLTPWVNALVFGRERKSSDGGNP